MPTNQDNLYNSKKEFIEQATKKLDETFDALSRALLETIIEEFADKLEKKDGKIVNSSYNLRLIASIENIFNAFSTSNLPVIAKQIATGADKISSFNADYFEEFKGERDYKATTQKVQKIIRDRLGITAEGNGKKLNLKPGGYMDSLLKDNTIKNELKDLSYKEVLKQIGFKDFKKGLEKFIQGDEEKKGGFKQYYRNYAYDIFVDVDRAESDIYANELDLQDFFYEGDLIDTSRHFCIERAGKLFNRKEAEEWKNDPWIKKNIERGYIISYDPVKDMGLFGCRHTPRFVSKEVADKLRKKESE